MELQIINTVTNATITFDDKSYILNNFQADNTKVTHNTSKTIKEIGEYLTASSVSSREIDLMGYIIGESKADLLNKQHKLMNLINPLQTLTIIVNNSFQIEVKALQTVQWGATWDNNNDQFIKFSITFLAPNTVWKDIYPTLIDFSPWVDGLIFPISIPEDTGMIFGHKTRNLYTSFFNPSNIKLGAKFTLTCLAEVTNPTIINLSTNEEMNLNVTLQPADELIIITDFNKKSVMLNGESKLKIFNFLNSQWLTIQPGENTFTYKTENNSELMLNIQVEFYQSYWGVSKWLN